MSATGWAVPNMRLENRKGRAFSAVFAFSRPAVFGVRFFTPVDDGLVRLRGNRNPNLASMF